jgi:hypothetical protein
MFIFGCIHFLIRKVAFEASLGLCAESNHREYFIVLGRELCVFVRQDEVVVAHL